MLERSIPIIVAGLVVLALVADEPVVVAAPDNESQYKALVSKVVLLERRLANQSSELSSLKGQISRVERELKNNRSSSGVSSTTRSNSAVDVPKIQRDTAAINSRLGRLETKVAGIDRSSLQRDIDRLEQKVSTLQADVQRLKSR